ncbi:hypothetical protein VAE130_150001 [Vibrio aestuarianus]|nr:hypothetical protein VAE130_150001 [Vibrio aestuarianus]
MEQQKSAYKRIEREQSDELYNAWSSESGEDRFDNNYRKLFMQLEKRLANAMNSDRSDQHSLSERGWTPPPKDYASELEEPKNQ